MSERCGKAMAVLSVSPVYTHTHTRVRADIFLSFITSHRRHNGVSTAHTNGLCTLQLIREQRHNDGAFSCNWFYVVRARTSSRPIGRILKMVLGHQLIAAV